MHEVFTVAAWVTFQLFASYHPYLCRPPFLSPSRCHHLNKAWIQAKKKKGGEEKHDWHFGWPVTSAYFDSDSSCSWPLLDADSAVSHSPKVSSRMHHFPSQFGSPLSSTKTFWMYYRSFLCIYKKKRKKKNLFQNELNLVSETVCILMSWSLQSRQCSSEGCARCVCLTCMCCICVRS